MADISKITLPNGNTYNIKDTVARNAIEAFAGGDAVVFMGVSSTALTDGGNENPTVNGAAVTSKAKGQLYFYGAQEYIYGADNKWHELGSLDSLGDLAKKDSITVKYDKASVNAKTFTGTGVRLVTGNIPVPATYTSTFSGNSLTSTGKFTPEGEVEVTTKSTSNKTATVSPASSGTVTYTPAGEVTQPTFSGTAFNSTGKFTPAGTISFTNGNTTTTVSAASSGTATYTPAGSVTAPTISVATAGSTTTIKNPTSVTVAKTVVAAAPGATAPNNAITYYSVSDETLSLYQLGYTTGASITTSNVTVKNGDAAYTASAPKFSGTGVRLVTGNISRPTSATFTGTEGDVTVSGTATGTVSKPTFSGTGVRLVTGNIAVPSAYTATFTGTEGDVSVSGTPAGSVTTTTATTSNKTTTVSKASSGDVTYTPEGSINVTLTQTSTNATVSYS